MTPKSIPISVVIIAGNAAATLEQCLDSLDAFDEVILYLNNSTDNSRERARSYPNVRMIEGEFTGFGPTKNRAAEHASHDWVLSLDSDEILPEALVEEIAGLKLENSDDVGVLERENLFYGKVIRRGGWGNDRLVRLYNRKRHAFTPRPVHEAVVTDARSRLLQLKSPFTHLAVTDINQLLEKIRRYSDLAAEREGCSPLIAAPLHAAFAFFRSYLLQLGFLEGWRGLVIAVSNANGRFYRYIKRYLKCRE